MIAEYQSLSYKSNKNTKKTWSGKEVRFHKAAEVSDIYVYLSDINFQLYKFTYYIYIVKFNLFGVIIYIYVYTAVYTSIKSYMKRFLSFQVYIYLFYNSSL